MVKAIFQGDCGISFEITLVSKIFKALWKQKQILQHLKLFKMKKTATLALEDREAYLFTVTVLVADFIFLSLLFLTH